jgi:hypothetical protein
MLNNLTKRFKPKLIDLIDYKTKLAGNTSKLNESIFKKLFSTKSITEVAAGAHNTVLKRSLGNQKSNNSNYIKQKEASVDSPPFVETKHSKASSSKQTFFTYQKIKNSYSGKKMMHQSSIHNYFGHSFLDRCSDKRRNAEWISQQMCSDQSVFVLFHGDRPFVLTSSDDQNMYSLYKFNYQEVKQFLEPVKIVNNSSVIETKCVFIFLGLEYEKKDKNSVQNQSECPTSVSNFEVCHSPYSSESLYSKEEGHKAWFAIDTSSFDENIESVTNLLSLDRAQFFEGSFLRLLAIQDSLQSSIIAQVILSFSCCFFIFPVFILNLFFLGQIHILLVNF